MLKIAAVLILVTAGFLVVLLGNDFNTKLLEPVAQTNSLLIEKLVPLTSPNPTPIALAVPPTKILENDYHIFQSFNNCGPAALSMALSYSGISKSQQELGEQLRPYQVPGGDNDDKSVTLEEVAEKSKEFGLIPYLGQTAIMK